MVQSHENNSVGQFRVEDEIHKLLFPRVGNSFGLHLWGLKNEKFPIFQFSSNRKKGVLHIGKICSLCNSLVFQLAFEDLKMLYRSKIDIIAEKSVIISKLQSAQIPEFATRLTDKSVGSSSSTIIIYYSHTWIIS